MRRITVATGSRAEYHLVSPIIHRLQGSTEFQCKVFKVKAGWKQQELNQRFSEHLRNYDPQMVLIPTDRHEMLPLAMLSFFSNRPTFHFLGGISSYGGVWDDVVRRVIDHLSHIVFVESEKAKERLVRAGEEEWRIIVTGTTHFDDVEIDESLVPKEPQQYDLFLMNPLSISHEKTKEELSHALRLLDKSTVFIGPNEDPNREVIIQAIKGHQYYYESLPRSQFLGLLKNAKRFISNSSAIHYEAPYFGIPPVVINPSIRNSQRDPIPRENLSGAADKVVEYLRTVNLSDPRLLIKKLD